VNFSSAVSPGGCRAMQTSEDNSLQFWAEVIKATRKAYGDHPLVDPAVDPMWAGIDDWYRIIDAAMAKAVAEGFTYFTCDWQKSRRHIVLLFRHPDGRRFQRALRVDARFNRNGRPPLTVTEIINLKIAIQTMIFYEMCDGPGRKLTFTGLLPLPLRTDPG
jgi:hypothetical protein